MFKKKHKIEVVPESEYTNFSSRVEDKYATNKMLIAAAAVPISVATGLAVTRITSTPTQYSSTVIPVSAPVTEPINVLAQTPVFTPTYAPEMIPTGFIADTSLEMLANVLDPLIQIMVAISFPIASVIMIGSCFFFMFGDNGKAWDGIFKSALGYILIQLSPLFLEILREVGKAV